MYFSNFSQKWSRNYASLRFYIVTVVASYVFMKFVGLPKKVTEMKESSKISLCKISTENLPFFQFECSNSQHNFEFLIYLPFFFLLIKKRKFFWPFLFKSLLWEQLNKDSFHLHPIKEAWCESYREKGQFCYIYGQYQSVKC